jgi:hypothetical protein
MSTLTGFKKFLFRGGDLLNNLFTFLASPPPCISSSWARSARCSPAVTAHTNEGPECPSAIPLRACRCPLCTSEIAWGPRLRRGVHGAKRRASLPGGAQRRL